jgi:uncharacterized membrane protein
LINEADVPGSSGLASGAIGAPARTRVASAHAALLARWSVGVMAFAWYAAFSLNAAARHLGGFDLAIFDQAIAKLAHFQAPVSDIKGFDLFGDHFHPIIVIVAPFYRIYPHASTLLVVQAAALGLSVVIVTKALQDVAGPWCGLAIGFAYAISWGLQSALYFGFHEVSLGVPIIAAACAQCLRRDWPRATICAAFLLLVKEDLALTVVALGVYLCIQRAYRYGVALIAGSLVWLGLVIGVVIPLLNPFGRYLYWPGGAPAQWTPGQPKLGLDASTLWSWQKVLTLVLVLAPMLFIALRSWLAIVLVPTLGWRFVSANPHYWGTKYHYSEILMPVTFLAGAAGLAMFGASRRVAARLRPPQLLRLVAVGAVVVGVAITAGFPFVKGIQPSYWRACTRCAAADAATAQVPAGVSVTADDALLPTLVDRDVVHVLAPGLVDGLGKPLRSAYVMVDTTHTEQYSQPGWLAVLQSGLLSSDYTQVFSRDGYVVYRKR